MSDYGNEIGVDFVQKEKELYAIDSDGNTCNINPKTNLRGQIRNANCNWESIYREWKDGTGPERSLFEGEHNSIKQIKRHYLYKTAYQDFIKKNRKKQQYAISWTFLDVFVTAYLDPSNCQSQMMGTYNASFYKLGRDKILVLIQDSKSKRSFYYHLPWVKNTPRFLGGSDYNKECNTYQTYIFLLKK